MIDPPFLYEMISKISATSEGCLIGTDTGWDDWTESEKELLLKS